jgi:hypothetical protein
MSGIRFDENAACEQCGRFGAYLFDGKLLCGECYEQHGSCCPEFEGRKQQEEAAAGPKCEKVRIEQEARGTG